MDFESIFKPSNNFVANLGSNKEDLFIKYSYYPPLSIYANQNEENLGEMLNIVLHDVINSQTVIICEYFKIRQYSLHSGIYRFDWVGDFLTDIIYNAYDHSPKETPFIVASYVGQAGLGMGFFDGGNFYKRPDIKKIFANKEHIISTSEKNIGWSGGNYGIRNIQTYPNFVEIDTEQGVLYCTVLKEKLFIKDN